MQLCDDLNYAQKTSDIFFYGVAHFHCGPCLKIPLPIRLSNLEILYLVRNNGLSEEIYLIICDLWRQCMFLERKQNKSL